MRPALGALVLLPLLLCGAAVGTGGPQSALVELREALLAGDAPRAVACLGDGARSHYARLLRLAHAGPAAEVRSLAPPDRALVRVLRRHAAPEVLSAGSLEASLARALAREPLPRAEAARFALAAPRIRGARADALLLRDGLPTGLVVVFHEHPGGWRIARLASPLFEPSALRLAAALGGLSEEQVLDEILDRLVGPAPAPE